MTDKVSVYYSFIHSFIHSLQFCSHHSYRISDIEQLLNLTDSFTWKELPTRDPNTGYLTKAGYFPIIQTLAKNVNAILIAFNIIQFIVRSVMSHDMLYASWYAFDVSVRSM